MATRSFKVLCIEIPALYTHLKVLSIDPQRSLRYTHLQPLVEDLHVQQAEEPAPQARPQRAVASLALPHNTGEEDNSEKG